MTIRVTPMTYRAPLRHGGGERAQIPRPGRGQAGAEPGAPGAGIAEKGRAMNEMKIFSNPEFGQVRTKETYNEKTDWSGTRTLVTPKGREAFRLLYVG